MNLYLYNVAELGPKKWKLLKIHWRSIFYTSLMTDETYRWVSARKTTPFLTHWSYVFLALTHRYSVSLFKLSFVSKGERALASPHLMVISAYQRSIQQTERPLGKTWGSLDLELLQCPPRLLHNPIVMATGLSVGNETWPPIGWDCRLYILIGGSLTCT